MRHERWSEVVAVFLKLGAMSYGGPAIMGVMQQEIQTRRNWVSRERFVEGLALVNMLPGPPAAQLSIFLGYSRLGWLGGVLAGVCFILPAFFYASRVWGTAAAVAGALLFTAALLAMLPHAVLDVTTVVLTLVTVVAIVAWRVSPLPAMAAGGAVGAMLKAR